MKKTILFLALLIIGFASCKKDDDNIPSKPSYHINGVNDLTLQKLINSEQAGIAYMSLELVYEHSDQEKVTLSLEGVPQKLKSTISSPSGIPSFSTSIILVDSGVAAGNYSITLVATGTSSGRKTYSFNVSVLAAHDCADDLVANDYSVQSSCNTTTYTENITKDTGGVSRILFNDFANMGAHIYGLVSCSTNQITIPRQVVNGNTYQGSGSYNTSSTGRAINIVYFRNSISCSMLLTR